MNDNQRDNLDALSALVAELRGRLPPNLTERQFQDIGNWMLKACLLGEGYPLEQVFEPVEYYNPKPELTVIEGDKSEGNI